MHGPNGELQFVTIKALNEWDSKVCDPPSVQHGVLSHWQKQCQQNQLLNLANISVLQLSGGVEWRQKLDTQRGAVLANELRNNACKLAKWTVQALLAGSDQIKFGYVQLLATKVAGLWLELLGFESWQVQFFFSLCNYHKIGSGTHQ
jgi:translation initiation factor 3 subunit D